MKAVYTPGDFFAGKSRQFEIVFVDSCRKEHYTTGVKMRSSLTWVAGGRTPLKVYVTWVINLGTWEEWREMRQSLSEATILEAVQQPLCGQWTPRGKAFAECVFGCTLPTEALISYA
jgi:hypothetical protein